MTTEDQNNNVAVIEAPARKKQPRSQDPKPLPPFNVVLLDDDEHTYEYVIMMLRQLFGWTLEQAFRMACDVDAQGRAIVDTTTKERAELKCEQIHAFGRDPRIPVCAGSMSAYIEPVPG